MVCEICGSKVRSKNLCSKHYSQSWRKKNPIKYTYSNLKANSKRRGKFFDLTFEQFKEFAIETEYIGKKGKTSDSYSIDRIDNNLGYTISNIRCITLSENSKKWTKQLFGHYDNYEKRVIATVKKSELFEQIQDDDCPF